MSKITALSPVTDFVGTEQLVLVKDGVTRRGAIDGLVGQAVAPYVSQAAISAATAVAASATAVINRRVYATTALGLADTSVGDYFFTPGSTAEEFILLWSHDAGAVASQHGAMASTELLPALQAAGLAASTAADAADEARYALEAIQSPYDDGLWDPEGQIFDDGEWSGVNRRTLPYDPTGETASVVLDLSEIVYDALNRAFRIGDGETAGGIDLTRTRRASLLTAAQYRSLTDKANDRFDLRDVVGADPAGNNSSAAALQKGMEQAIEDGVALHVPTGKFVCDATITTTNALTILGEGAGIGRAVAGYTTGAAIGPASCIHFAHGGEGIRFGDGTAVYDGVLLRDLMFTRDQPPIPLSGTWEPNDHDYNLVMYGMAGLHLENILDLNPTRGINMLGGGSIGRLWTQNYYSQPLVTGINIELCADVPRFIGTHFWPFWHDHPKVNAFTVEHCDHVWLKRCDTPMFTSFFSIASRSAFRIGKNSYGSVSKMKVSNYDIDYSKLCIWFDDTSQNSWARFSNGTLQANNSNGAFSNLAASDDRQNLLMEGTNCFVMFDGLEIAGASGTAMDTGENNHLEIAGDLWVQNYGEVGGSTDPCIHVGAGSSLTRHGPIRDTSPDGLGPMVGGTGRVVGVTMPYTPAITPQAGALGSASLIDAYFVEDGYTVSGTVNLLISNAGTATGYIDIALPTAADMTSSFSAIDLTSGSALNAISLPTPTAVARISKPGGGNVGVTGHTISLTFSYVRKAS